MDKQAMDQGKHTATAGCGLPAEHAVRFIIAKQLGVAVAAVVAEARLAEDLGADSLALAQLALALEERYEIDVPDEDMLRLRTVHQVVEYVEALRTPSAENRA